MKQNKTEEIMTLIKKYEKDLEDAKHDSDRFHLAEAEGAASVLQTVISDLQNLIGVKAL